LAVCLALAAALGLVAARNLRAGPPQQQGSSAPNQMKVHVDLVPVIASVLTAAGKPVPDLPRQDFRIFEDGRPQQIAVFQRQTDLPLDLALMIDTSLSAYGDMKFERQAAERFIGQVLRPGDRMAIFTFAYTVSQLSPFTGDAARLDGAMRRIRTGSGTSLFDAIYLGAHALERRPPGHRRVLLLLTDAGETTSSATYDQARQAALRAGAMLYTVLIRVVKSENGRNTAGEHAIETIIDTTGGALYPVDEPKQFNSTFDRINEELRTEYLLGYYPNPAPVPGSYHNIVVRLRAPGSHYVVRYRKGYYTPETSQ
jgi:Ca-activated chloride channel family protein